MLNTAIVFAPLVKKMRINGLDLLAYNQPRICKKEAPEMELLSESDVQDAMDFFRKAGYNNPMYFGLIVSYYNLDDLRKKSLLFFGKTKDPDYAAEQEECYKKADDYFKKYILPDLIEG